VYETSLNFKDFNYDIKFIKWSSIEFLNSNEVPKDYKTYILKAVYMLFLFTKVKQVRFQKYLSLVLVIGYLILILNMIIENILTF
jgi:hypothetical protein